jgi:hypothetical protein
MLNVQHSEIKGRGDRLIRLFRVCCPVIFWPASRRGKALIRFHHGTDTTKISYSHSFRWRKSGGGTVGSVGIGVQHELSVLALVKGGERFIFVYDDVSREKLIDAIRDQAADPKVALSWFDAAVLTERARQQATVGNPGDSPRNGA